MAGNCFQSALKRNMRRPCGQTLTTGVDELYYIGQLRDLAGYTPDSTSSVIISDIVMKPGKFLNVYEGYPKALEPTVGHEETDLGPKLPQGFKFAIRSNSPETKEEVQAFVYANDLFVIYKRAGAGDFEVMGIDNGMKIPSGGLNYAPNDATSGAFVITLSNPDAIVLPYTFRHKASGGALDTAEELAKLARPDA